MSKKGNEESPLVPDKDLKECEFKIEGMDCASCALKVENKLKRTEGIRDVRIMVTAEKAAVYYDRTETNPANIKQAIKEIGYETEEYRSEAKPHQRQDLIRLSLVVAAVLLSWAGLWRSFPGIDVFSVLVVAIAGIPIYREAYTALRARNITIEVAMTIGIGASIVINEFLAAAVIVLFTLFADYLDDLTTDRGRRAIRELLKIFPQEATVVRNGEEVRSTIDSITHDETIIVKPGERVPVDGKVVEGKTHVNQAPITGESKPVNKGPDDKVLAGSISDGLLKIKVTKVGRDTALGKIIRLVEEAEGAKSKVQKFADRFALRFVPAVLLLSLGVYVFTGNAPAAIATIVVACPCAIALATPLAVVASAGRAARHGIIIKGGVFLEELSKIDTVVLDKTGTLTIGEPRISQIESFAGHTEQEVLRVAATAERYSEHPLAKAVLQTAADRGLSVPAPKEFEAVKGQGVKAHLDGERSNESESTGTTQTHVAHDH
ncbi:MAG: heavy metal translocating P-type ATPase, partial [Terriglobia bacterium]